MSQSLHKLSETFLERGPKPGEFWSQTTESFSRQSLGSDEPWRVRVGRVKQEKVLGLREECCQQN